MGRKKVPKLGSRDNPRPVATRSEGRPGEWVQLRNGKGDVFKIIALPKQPAPPELHPDPPSAMQRMLWAKLGLYGPVGQ